MEALQIARRRMYCIARQVGLGKDDENQPSGSLAVAVCSAGSGAASSRKDNRLFYARQGSHTQAFFMRQTTGKQVAFFSDECFESPLPVHGPSVSSTVVTGSREKLQQDHGNSSLGKSTVENKQSQEYAKHALDEGPLFARKVNDSSEKEKVTAEWQQHDTGQQNHKSTDFEWFPRMDVVESSSAYVVIIELPGASADGIRLEVNNNSLIATGTRSTEWWSGVSGEAVYYRRELAQGPYRAVWHIPDNSNSEKITAEFVDGFLRVLIPKATS